MSFITAEENSQISSKESFAQAFIREVNNDLNDVKHSFIKIGFRLVEADKLNYYKELGYESLVELAEAEFGFKKTTTYEMMKVYELYHDPNSPMHISDKYDKFSHSQLLVLARVKYDGTAFWEIVKPTDSVLKLKRFVSNWNEKYATGCGYRPGLKTVDEYLKAYDDEQTKKQVREIEYAGQLPGQIALSLPAAQDEFSARAENSKLEEVLAVMTDGELIKYCLKLGGGKKGSKFRIMRCHSEFTRTSFVAYVRDEYGYSGRMVHDEPYSSIDCNRESYTIYRLNGGKIVLTWSVVAGYISRMIEADEYLTESEKEEYRRWQSDFNGFAVSVPTEEAKEVKEEFSARAENLETEQVQQIQLTNITNKEYLVALPDKQFVSELCMKIIRIFPMGGKSSQFMSTVQNKLVEWLGEIHGRNGNE